MKTVSIILLFFLYRMAEAQTCTGSLGDPIVGITFGRGHGPGPALASGITNLNYIQGGCPRDGAYTIVNNTSGCFNNSWLTITRDHTGDDGGYFMLINASYQPSDFYVQTINGLCGGTSYQFAAWVMNVGVRPNQIRPNITFRIEKTDGTVLQSFNTGDVPLVIGATWKQYAFYFNTPPGVNSVVIRIINNAPGGSGNDLALDDITFRAAGPSIKTSVAGFPGDTVNLCANDPQILHLNAVVENCFALTVYQWQASTDGGKTWGDIPGAKGQTYDRPSTGTGGFLYRVTVVDAANAGIASCSVASLPLTINVLPVPNPSVTIRSSLDYACAGMPALFVAKPVDGGKAPLYQWAINGVNTGTGDDSLVTAALASTDVISCVMTSNAACAANPVVPSNTLSIPVIPIPLTGVDIVATADHVCRDSVVVFTATPLNGGARPTYEWKVNGVGVASPAAVYTTGQLNDGDLVSCTMTGGLVCSLPVTAPEVIHMTVYPLPAIVLTPDTVIAGGVSIRLSPVLSGDITGYQWSPVTGLNDPGIARPVATPVSTTAYQLKVVTADGCQALAVERIAVYYDVNMPGAFTPNGDGRNDQFRVPPSIPVKIHWLAVYSRQGVMLFSTTNVSRGWDGSSNGKSQPAGVYIWAIEYENPVTKKVEMKKGTLVLIK
jgi:gliding motility-associated-like protein